MTADRRAALVEKVARVMYEATAARFAADPVTAALDGFAEQVFPPWDEANRADYLSDASAAIDLALEEAARVADDAEAFDRQAAREPNDAEELAAFMRGAFKSRNIAAARIERIEAALREDARDFADRIELLEGLVKRAQSIIDPCFPEKCHQWQKDARAALGEKP